MGKKLVIVESPAKAKTINKYLGKDYVVKASLGHVRDLPVKKLGVDLENDFTPEYVNSKGKSKVIQELKKVAKDCEEVYLAPDPDREGEAIAWHLKELLKKGKKEVPFYRVTYNEITKSAIQKAFSDPHEIDQRKVDAQQARRILDRIVGYQVSPMLWRRVRGASSAGRVQTVALRLVCEREREIQNFVPETYWVLGANVHKEAAAKDVFEIKLAKLDDEKADLKDAKLVEEINEELNRSKLAVSQIQQKQIQKKAAPPLITSTLQQAASSSYGFTPKRTMGIAQKLYEAGNITYMRTDSVSMSDEAIAAAREWVTSSLGAEYVPKSPNKYKSKGSAQEAHECIRPTNIEQTPDALKADLSAEEAKLYDLIWRRAVASQMAPAKISQRTISIAATGDGFKHSYEFRVTDSQTTFPGYQAVTKEKKKDDEKQFVPELAENDPLVCKEWLSEEKQTQPPGRYSEASLIRALEENGVGRPSTYAQTISTITDREYVLREKRALQATELGLKVNDFLLQHLEKLFDVQFTAKMEELLDEVEEGKMEWTGMLKSFYENFETWMEDAKGAAADKGYVKKLLDVMEPVSEWEPP